MTDRWPPIHKTPADDTATAGTVYLVGAGPGDPGLLTVRAHQLLESADLIAYDDLISIDILCSVRIKGDLLSVGYRGVMKGGQAPDPVHPEIISRAKAGQSVVRLKSGDPVVLGRIADEAAILRSYGIPFEIVPGITAASGASAYAGIPLTHKGTAGRFEIASAYAADPTAPSEQDMVGKTLVLYMVRRHLRAFTNSLMSKGTPASLPAAFILGATTPGQQVVVGTVKTIADQVGKIQDDRPGLVMIGETVNLRTTVQWYQDGRPLAGRKILVGRSRPGPSDITRRLRALGATVTESSWVHATPLANALSQLVMDRPWNRHSVILFACREGAQAFYNGLRRASLDWRVLSNCRIAAMGDEVAEFLRDLGIAPDVTAPGHCREAVFTIAEHLTGQNICVITSETGRPQLTQDLRDIAQSVTECPLYKVSRTPLKQHASAPIDAAIVPSSTTADDVVGILRSTTGCESTPIITIGPRSAASVRAITGSTVIQTETDTINAVIQLVKQVIVEGIQPL